MCCKQISYTNRVNANYIIVPPYGCLTFEVTVAGAYNQVCACATLCVTAVPSREKGWVAARPAFF